jgi:hypothetical protein
MSAREAHVELLIGRMVHDSAGRALGRLEEIRAIQANGEMRVSEYLVGVSGLAVRLSSSGILPRILQIFGGSRKSAGFAIPWQWMDLSDPDHPRCTHPREDLSPVDEHTPAGPPRS